jgi:hypothetical protein
VSTNVMTIARSMRWRLPVGQFTSVSYSSAQPRATRWASGAFAVAWLTGTVAGSLMATG